MPIPVRPVPVLRITGASAACQPDPPVVVEGIPWRRVTAPSFSSRGRRPTQCACQGTTLKWVPARADTCDTRRCNEHQGGEMDEVEERGNGVAGLDDAFLAEPSPGVVLRRSIRHDPRPVSGR